MGETGELWITGPGMLQGYFGQREAEADAFRGGWFRTGDLFRQDGDGYDYMLGRIKDVIRRSGENISAAEIEAVVLEIKGVAEAAAVPVPDSVRGEEVKLYVALPPPHSAADLSPEQIAAFCRERLAGFKVPRYIEYRALLPRTASNKIAKEGLRSTGSVLPGSTYDTVACKWL